MRITIISFILILSFNFQFVYSKLVINEIMPAPLDGEPEWIEIFNSGNENIYLSDIFVSDAVTTKKIPDFNINSNQYCILVKDTNLLKSFRNIPLSALLIQTSALPALNNTTDYIVLKAFTDKILDSVYYDMKWGEKGISLERIDYNSPAINIENWGKCINHTNSTIGEFNSISIINYDLVCRSINFSSPFNIIEISIKDEGINKIENFTLSIFLDTNFNQIYEKNELVVEYEDLNLEERDTLVLLDISLLKEFVTKNATYYLSAVVYSTIDQRRINDTSKLEIMIRKELPELKINEIMYDVSETNAEFIEIWNGGIDTVIMDNYLIWDAAGSMNKGNIKINSPHFKIPPKEYGVITWDSIFFENFPELKDKSNVYYYKSGFNLNLNNDLIVLADFNGQIYDSLTYFNLWHDKSLKETKNRSLEKINEILISSNSNSWNSCAETSGSTPARKNSLTREIKKAGIITVSPNPFKPSLGGTDAFTVINYELPFMKVLVNIKICDISGFEIVELANNRYSAGWGAITWDGKNSEGFYVQTGQYIMIIEATDSETGDVYQEKVLIVLA